MVALQMLMRKNKIHYFCVSDEGYDDFMWVRGERSAWLDAAENQASICDS